MTARFPPSAPEQAFPTLRHGVPGWVALAATALAIVFFARVVYRAR
jgi:hypothetical protein